MYYLFKDKKTGEEFVVFEYSKEEAEHFACVNFDDPEFVRVIPEFEVDEMGFDVY